MLTSVSNSAPDLAETNEGGHLCEVVSDDVGGRDRTTESGSRISRHVGAHGILGPARPSSSAVAEMPQTERRPGLPR